MPPEIFLRTALNPALWLLPATMESPAARALLLTIAAQESALKYRRQLHGGPARSYFQFEKVGVKGVLTHRVSADHATRVCELLDVKPTLISVHRAIEFHDVLATAFARLLLWQLPRALPTSDQPEDAYAQYIALWKPGKRHPHSWLGFFVRAWQVVTSDT